MLCTVDESGHIMSSINPTSTQHRLSNDLVQINSNLRYELDHSIELCTLLNNENQLIKQSYEQQKVELNELKQQLNDAKSVAEQTLHMKQSIESECQQLYTQWKLQLESITQSFNTYQLNSISKNELQIQSVVLSEKYDNIYKIKFDELTQQIHKYHTLYQQAQQQINTINNTWNESKQLYTHEIDVLHKQHTIQIDQFNEKNTKLQQLLQSTDTHNDTIRTLQRNNNELIVVIAQGKNEVARLHEQIDNLQQQINNNSINTNTDLNKYKNECQSIKSDNSVLQQLIDKLKLELNMIQHDNTELCDKNIQLQSEIQLISNKLIQSNQLHHEQLHTQQSANMKLQNELVELKQQLIDEKQEVYERFDMERKQYSTNETESKSTIDSLNDKIKSLELHLSTIELQHKNELSQLHQRLMTAEHTISTQLNTIDKYKSTVNEYERTNHTSTRHSDTIQNELQQKQNEIKSINDKYMIEIRKLNEIIDNNKSERSILLQRIQNFEDNINSNTLDTIPSNDHMNESDKLKYDKIKYKKLCVMLQKKLETVVQDFSLYQTQHSNCNVTKPPA